MLSADKYNQLCKLDESIKHTQNFIKNKNKIYVPYNLYSLYNIFVCLFYKKFLKKQFVEKTTVLHLSNNNNKNNNKKTYSFKHSYIAILFHAYKLPLILLVALLMII